MDLEATKKLTAKLRELVEAEIICLGPPPAEDMILYSEQYQEVWRRESDLQDCVVPLSPTEIPPELTVEDIRRMQERKRGSV